MYYPYYLSPQGSQAYTQNSQYPHQPTLSPHPSLYEPSPQPSKQQTSIRQQSEQNQQRKITVTGTASISAQPDIASIRLAVITEDSSLQQAQQENANRMNQVIHAIVGQGIPREKIQTSWFAIQARYDYVEGRQVFRGYEVLNEITVRIPNIEQTGVIIDTAVNAGVNRVTHIQFTIENRDVYEQQALQLAVRNATEKARAIAGALQVMINEEPLKVTEEIEEQPQTYQVLATAQDQVTTPIEPGQVVIKARVTAVFLY
ncbi:SIMPL domain-containing protein [Oceanobacillus salinisoli]|uniref:SIMPL domain-containing protein n=1 Tax=Oceanobacillus salinisoli TaxID=2678611 RepID=UPI0012E12C41|nr:SIMPL domain-containing protein [Oceanobacillus salinisoli]